MKSRPDIRYDSEKQQYQCHGDWELQHVSFLQAHLKKLPKPKNKAIQLDGLGITKMDSAGAYLLDKWQLHLEKEGFQVVLENFSERHSTLLSLIKTKIEAEKPLPKRKKGGVLESLGETSVESLNEVFLYLVFMGKLTLELLRIIHKPFKARFSAYASVIYKDGYLALPIIALLSFMIGVVITYQMGLQLRNYGANVYIIDLLGLAILREFGPLLTAIMVAGRTGSAFTAQLGIMKINQEIDALDTMGVTSAELLLIPRMISLLIILPLLTMWADIFGVLGGMVMSNNMLSITWHDFLVRFPHVIKLKNLLIGLGKAPVFAFIIGGIGCFEGMRVSGSANSIGQNTTRSVVLSIFFIIVADAIFSIMFSKLKL